MEMGFCFGRAWARLAQIALFAGLLVGTQAQAGVMTRETMAQAFPAPLVVGEKERDVPVWPIYAQDLTSTTIIAYAFESIDFAAIPGFSGTPFNLLVALDKDGKFMDVKVLSQHEPVFLDGLGPQPLFKFVEQYKNLSLKQSIKIGLNRSAQGEANSANVYIDGVAKATASVRILNQSLLAASLKVARAKMGYGEGTDPDLIARIRPDVYEALDWSGQLRAGLVGKKVLTNAEVEAAFKGTAVEGADDEARSAPNAPFTTLYFAHLNVPSVGRNLLPAQTWEYLQKRLDPGDHALLVLSKGRYPIVSEDFQRGTVPDRLSLNQNKLSLEMRDLDLDTQLKLPENLQDAQWRVFRVISAAGLDPSVPLDFELLVSRSKGQFMPEVVNQRFAFSAELPDKYFEAASSDSKTWRTSWTSRWWELLVLLTGLGVLGWALCKPAWLAASPQRLRRFRNGYLVFTLVFIGWYAQGQLSIVNLTALVQAVLAGRSLAFFLYDPMTVLLWVFVVVTFFVWGRGTFCGWLCPFGALQDLLSQVTRRVGLKPLRVSTAWDRQLKRLKYGVLAVILIAACVSVGWTDRLVEVEPFKTSITLNFVREWPFVLWAVAAVLASSLVYKGYCRYLCPLGAGMGLLGRLRRFDWIARRSECGQPCQRCRSDCAYQAIEKSGQVDYDECFQCMDCVVIHDSETLCVPLYNSARKAAGNTVIPIVPLKGKP
jgi:NosR/NirI family transcriptional regulator, nitrous oxide reductase regulator